MHQLLRKSKLAAAFLLGTAERLMRDLRGARVRRLCPALELAHRLAGCFDEVTRETAPD